VEIGGGNRATDLARTVVEAGLPCADITLRTAALPDQRKFSTRLARLAYTSPSNEEKCGEAVRGSVSCAVQQTSGATEEPMTAKYYYTTLEETHPVQPLDRDHCKVCRLLSL